MFACFMRAFALQVCLSCLRRFTFSSEGRNHAGCTVPCIVYSGSIRVPCPFGGCWHRNKVSYLVGSLVSWLRSSLVCSWTALSVAGRIVSRLVKDNETTITACDLGFRPIYT